MKLFFIIILSFISLGCEQFNNKAVCFKDTCLKCEVADSDFERQKGLMGRNTLKDNEGMLFVFEQEGFYSLWMKNMKIPLDIIWISEDKKVVDITTNALPCQASCESLIPAEAVKFALEVNSGSAKQHGIQVGDIARF